MKKLLLIFCYLFTLTTFAQDWAPFKSSDTLKHYHHFFGFGDSQIQSVAVDSSYLENNVEVKILMRGFNESYFYSTPSVFYQIVKGQILGDTLRIYNDSSIITSIDELGYRLNFPHQYSLSKTFTLGSSIQFKLVAQVDSMFIDSVNGTIDSLARFSIAVYDSLGQLDTSHFLHGSESSISKNSGLIKTINFTHLHDKEIVDQYFFNKNEFTNQDKYALTVGDEFHYILDSTIPGSQHWHQMKIIRDTMVLNQRTMTFEHTYRKRWGPPGPITIDTFQRAFRNDSVISNTNSLLVESKAPFFGSYTATVQKFQLCGNCGFNSLIRAWDQPYRIFNYGFLVQYADSVEGPSGLNGSTGGLLMGVDDFYTTWGNNGNGADRQTKTIVYIKNGNQTWGTPLNLTVGLNELGGSVNSLKVYPNPSTDLLTIKGLKRTVGFKVFDLSGKLVLSGITSKMVDISDLSNGLHFLTTPETGEVYRFVKH